MNFWLIMVLHTKDTIQMMELSTKHVRMVNGNLQTSKQDVSHVWKATIALTLAF